LLIALKIACLRFAQNYYSCFILLLKTDEQIK